MAFLEAFIEAFLEKHNDIFQNKHIAAWETPERHEICFVNSIS
jgi:hypothetical protein